MSSEDWYDEGWETGGKSNDQRRDAYLFSSGVRWPS